MSDYHDRKPIRLADGTLCFQTAEDRAAEERIAGLIEERTTRKRGEGRGWKMRHFARLSPIDWYAVQDGRVIGLAELKDRKHALDRHPTVFLSVRKWLALRLGSIGLGVPAIFVASFTDGVRWQSLKKIDPRKMKLGGGRKAEPSPNDIEPVIEVPIDEMRTLEELPPEDEGETPCDL